MNLYGFQPSSTNIMEAKSGKRRGTDEPQNVVICIKISSELCETVGINDRLVIFPTIICNFPYD